MKEQSLETTITDRRVRRKRPAINPLPLTRRLSRPYELQPPHQNTPTRFPLKKAA
jgi:hypothetical protein